MKKPRSKALISTSTPSSGPSTHGTRRRARVGSARARPTTTSPSSGSRAKAARGELPRPDREHEREPHDRQGKQREHGGHDRVPGPGRGGAGGRLVPVPPQPPDVAAERLGEHGEREDQQYAAHPQRRNAGSRDHERDPLRGRHRLAPVAPRQRRPQPRERPARREERVAREADQEHPAAGRRGDLDAEHEDQERVDLSVQLRAERRLRPRAPGEPAVDEIERQRDGRERHQCRGRHRELEGSRGQRGDARPRASRGST